VMIYLRSGKLPWHGIPRGGDRLERYNAVVKKKFETKPEELITADMPYEFYLFYQYCRDLAFDQRPDYGYLHRLLRDLIYAESFEYMIAFQWVVEEQLISTSLPKSAKSSLDGSGRALGRRLASGGVTSDQGQASATTY
jgi:hypothetical protein